jgi:phosphonate degradation associated HDIG domain protein
MTQIDLKRASEISHELLAVLESARTAEYIGEPVSQLEHGLQAAWHAQRSGATEAVILAALFHDIGHLIDPAAEQMEGLGVVNHEVLGADYLKHRGCAHSMTQLVQGHVNAKRYLCARKPTYHNRLSEASKGTLRWQGGPMTEDEATLFEESTSFRSILALRQWDEMAKDPCANVPDLDHYAPMLIRHLQGN